MTRIRLWWLLHELRRHRKYQREDMESACVEADICDDLLRKINALTAPVVVTLTSAPLRVVK
jgi:hypothetical protein